MSLQKWDRCGGKLDAAALAGRPCWGGLDLGSTADLVVLRAAVFFSVSLAASDKHPANGSYLPVTGDSLGITVFGEPDLWGGFEVDSMVVISLALIGRVHATGFDPGLQPDWRGGVSTQGPESTRFVKLRNDPRLMPKFGAPLFQTPNLCLFGYTNIHLDHYAAFPGWLISANGNRRPIDN